MTLKHFGMGILVSKYSFLSFRVFFVVVVFCLFVFLWQLCSSLVSLRKTLYSTKIPNLNTTVHFPQANSLVDTRCGELQYGDIFTLMSIELATVH